VSRKRLLTILLTVLATAFVVLLIANLSLGNKRVDQRVSSLYAAGSVQFARTMGAILGPAMLPGNRVEALVNGTQIFPAMLQAIRGARRSITMETYIWWSGDIGEQFTQALSERASAGVRVHLTFDAVGSGKIEEDHVERMRAAGVQVARYNPLRWYTLARFNHRTHRKLLVVDGRVGFTGGAGIADEWSGNAQDAQHWRDTHFRLEGPAVAQMQSAFLENWISETGVVLHGEDYFPPLEPQGAQEAQVFTSSPGGSGENMQLMYLLSLAAARQTVQLSAAYFVPDDVAIDTFVAALKRGVRVQIIMPGSHIDMELVRRASRASWGRLLRAGAELYEYQPTMYHCKVLIVDGTWVSVGSTNFDSRSFSVNDEANLNVLDRDFALEQERIFERDLERSRRVSLQEWEHRPWTEKIWEHTIALISSQL
jgi:cardiolipin synthase